MRRLLATSCGLSAVIISLILWTAGSAQQDDADSETAQRDVEHGRYLVHDVCLCVVCHSPRDAAGEVIDVRILTGGTIPLASPYAEQEWAFRAPKIAGLPAGWTEEEFVHFLQTRRAPHGRTVRLPMPPFHLSEQDARDVAAYLATLR